MMTIIIMIIITIIIIIIIIIITSDSNHLFYFSLMYYFVNRWRCRCCLKDTAWSVQNKQWFSLSDCSKSILQ